MYKTLRRMGLLLAFVCVIVGCAIFSVACNPAPDDAGSEGSKVTYSVTVTTESSDITLTSLKAQWLKGTSVAAEKALDKDGKATAELDAGNYTVKLTGLPAGYTCADATVTKDNPATTLEIKTVAQQNITYVVTVTAPDGITLPANVTAQLYSGDTAVGEAVTVEEGEASFTALAGEYTVKLANLPAYLTYNTVTLTASAKTAEIKLGYSQGTIVAVAMVTLPEGITVDGLAVQLYSGNEEYGAPITVSEGRASISVPYGSYTIKLNVPDYLTYEAPILTPATGLSVTINVTLAEVEYKVTVSCEDEDISEVKVTLYDAQGEAASDATALVDGVATFTLLAGEYTARLTGAPEGYEYEEASLTKSEREATITLTAVEYTITVKCNGLEYSAITVKLTAGDKEYTGTLNEEFVATVKAPAGTYAVEVEANDYKHFAKEVTAENRTAEIELAKAPTGGTKFDGDDGVENENDPWVITATGNWFITAGARPDFSGYDAKSSYIKFTAPDEGERLYTFTWIAESDSDTVSSSSVDNSVNGFASCSDTDVKLILNKGAESEFVLSYMPVYSHVVAEDDEFHFILKIESNEAPKQGDKLRPIELDSITGTHSASEGLEEAYFKLPANTDNYKYTFTFTRSISIYRLPMNINASPATITSGEPVQFSQYVSDYLRVTSPEGATISFTVEIYYELGTANNPAELQLGVETTRKIPMMGLGNNFYWYKVTPSEENTYRFTLSSGSGEPFKKLGVYGRVENNAGEDQVVVIDMTGDDYDLVPGGEKENTVKNKTFHLDADKTYYIYLEGSNGHSITFTLDISDNYPEGSKENPKVVTNTGETINTVECITTGDENYFKHVITAESLNAENKFIFKFSPKPSSTQVHFYSDSNFATQIGMIDYGEESVTLSNLSAGQTVYFTIKTYTQSLSFYINPVESAVTGPVLKLDQELEVTAKRPGPYESYAEADIVLQDVPEGTYEIVFVKVTQSNEPIKITAGSKSVSVGPESGTAEIEIASGVKTLHVRTDGTGWDVTFKITLRKPVVKLTTEKPITVELSTSTTEIPIDAPAGKYNIKFEFSTSAMFGVQVGSGSSDTFNGNTNKDYTISEGDKITINNYMSSPGITVTLTLTSLSKQGLTVGTPYVVKFTYDSDYNVEIHVPLVNVPAGTYKLALEASSDWQSAFSGAYTITAGQNSTQTATGKNTSTAIIEIPDDCEEIVISRSSFAPDYDVTLTLTAQ